MANFFDQFDEPKAQPQKAPGNFFDQFDAPAPSPAAQPAQFDAGRFDLGSVKNDPGLKAGLDARGAAAEAARPPASMDRVGVTAGGFVEGIPIIGPLLTGGAERLAALAVSPFVDETYDQLLERSQKDRARTKSENPILDTAAQIAGGVGATMAAGGTAVGKKLLGDVGGPLLHRVGAGIISGAGIGGADALVRSGGDVNAAMQGAGVGGAIGGAAPAVIAGVGRVADAAAKRTSAGYRVKEALSRDAAAGNQMLTRQELEALQSQGVPVAVADMGGETTRALARSAANNSPEARDALNRVVSERFSTQSTRIADEVASLSPLGANATASLDALKAQAQAANRPAYAKAYARGAAGVWDADLAALTRAPDIADAIRGATRTGGNKAVADGFRPVTNPFVTDSAGNVVLRTAADGSQAVPSLQFWDHVKRNLDDVIGRAQRSGDRNAAADAMALKNQLVAKLDAAVPDYAAARQGAASFFGAEDALEAGQKFVTARGQNADFAKAIGRMNDAEKKLFQEGYTSALSSKLLETPDRLNAVNQILRSPADRQRALMALGTQGVAKLEARLRVENIMDMLRTAVQGNSTTARQLAEMGLAGTAGGALGGWQGGDWSSAGLGMALGMAARKGFAKVDVRAAQKVGELLSSSDPRMIERAYQMAATRPAVMHLLEGTERFLVTNSGVAGGQAGRSMSEPISITVKPAR